MELPNEAMLRTIDYWLARTTTDKAPADLPVMARRLADVRDGRAHNALVVNITTGTPLADMALEALVGAPGTLPTLIAAPRMMTGYWQEKAERNGVVAEVLPVLSGRPINWSLFAYRPHVLVDLRGNGQRERTADPVALLKDIRHCVSKASSKVVILLDYGHTFTWQLLSPSYDTFAGLLNPPC